MKGYVFKEANKLVWKYDDETVWIEPYGKDSLRVRVTKLAEMPLRDWAFIGVQELDAAISIHKDYASICNGSITATINKYGYIRFENGRGEVILKELWQNRDDEKQHISLMYSGRELKPIPGGLYKGIVTFESHDDEKIYGGGQRQIPYLDIKGCDLELAQRNSQANIPFVLSSKGYGFFWNNPAYGAATFAKNHTRWSAEVTPLIDYWVTVGETPAEILEKYTSVVGRAPEFPEWAAGFWQCKLRYRTQEELLEVAREYKKRGLPVSVIVIDFFHWPQQGEWKFDPQYWPDPQAMVDELKEMGITLMVSIWPTVDPRSENYAEMKAEGMLVRTDRGVRTQQVVLGAEVYYDATNPKAREYVWQKVKQNYGSYGIRMFWLDEAEPEYTYYDFDNYRYYLGPNLEVGNIYPYSYAQGFYEGMKKDGIKDVINLIRCAWAGSQKFGVVLWSGDIHSNFETLRMQVVAGLNAGLSGIPWWTTDIGGFFGGDPQMRYFRELIVRWFQFGVFCPVFRLHGWRLPMGESVEGVDTGLFDFNTCGPNEIWEFGDEAYQIISKLILLRERLKPYIMEQMKAASEKGTPPIRPMFYDFPHDPLVWDVKDQFMFGPDIMVAPVLYEGMDKRKVYLPAGNEWKYMKASEVYNGGMEIICDAPLDTVPVFIRSGAVVEMVFKLADTM